MSGGCLCVCVCIRSLLHSVHFGQQLHCAHERIVNRIKVYIEGNNMQVELIQFLKKNIAFIHVYFCEASNSTRPACLRLDSRYNISLFDSNHFYTGIAN